MNRLLAGAVALLGIVSGVRAEELQWHAAAPRNAASAVTLGRPVSLGRPVALPPAPVNPGITQTSYQAPATLGPIVRMQSAEGHTGWATGTDRPTATGASVFATGSTTVADVRSFSVSADVPPTAVVPPAATTTPLGSGTVISGPVSAMPVGAVPLASPTGFASMGTQYGTGDILQDDFGAQPGGIPCWKRFYGGAEYLLWAIRDQRYPALVTTGSPTAVSNVPPPLHASGGVLGDPSTSVLFGGVGQPVHSNEFSGGRFTLGWWCDCDQTKGIEFSYFFLGQKTNHFGADSGQFPVLARPFFNQNLMSEDAEFTAFPNFETGRVDVSSFSRLWGAQTNFRCRVCCDSCCCDCCDCCPMHYHLDLLAGFRYLDLTEGLGITESVKIVGSNPSIPVPVGTTAQISDQFGTRNQFYGGQVGADFNFGLGRWSADFLAKIALGDNHQVVNINGNQVVTVPGMAPQVVQGGLLALPSNSGRFTRDSFAVVPELGVKLGYNVTDNLRLTVGYTWIYWSNVVRPGDQIDRVLDVRQIPFFPSATPLPAVVGPSHPLPLLRQTDFWAQGVTFGMQYNY